MLKKLPDKRTVFVLSAFITALQPMNSSAAASWNISDNNGSFTSMTALINSAGICYKLNRPRAFFKYPSQPNQNVFKFSLETDKDVEQELTRITSAEQVVDIQKQLVIADRLYKSVLKLEPPLSAPRYQNAKFITVTIAPANRAYGIAYDEVTTNNNLSTPDCFISMKVSNQVFAHKNNTPAHELFHLYQNSYMMFKQGWLTEGLARWSESLLAEGVGAGVDTPLPKNRAELLEVMDKSYGASTMWVRLFKLLDDDEKMMLTNDMKQQKYLNGKTVVSDDKALGTEFIAILFEELHAESISVSKQKGWNIYGWREADQRDKALNKDIWTALKRAVNKKRLVSQQSDELRQFLAIEL